jgi:hypothetical protein
MNVCGPKFAAAPVPDAARDALQKASHVLIKTP